MYVFDVFDSFKVSFLRNSGNLLLKLGERSGKSGKRRFLEFVKDNLHYITIKFEFVKEGRREPQLIIIRKSDILTDRREIRIKVELDRIRITESIILHLIFLEFTFSNGKKDDIDINEEYELSQISKDEYSKDLSPFNNRIDIPSDSLLKIKKTFQSPVKKNKSTSHPKTKKKNDNKKTNAMKELTKKVLKESQAIVSKVEGLDDKSHDLVKNLGTFYYHSDVELIPDQKDLIKTDKEKRILEEIDEIHSGKIGTLIKSSAIESLFILAKSFQELKIFDDNDKSILSTVGEFTHNLINHSPPGVEN